MSAVILCEFPSDSSDARSWILFGWGLVPARAPDYLGAMCNDYEQHVTWAAYCKMMQDLALGIPTQQSALDLPQADDIRINDLGPVMRASGNGIELTQMRFGFPPSNPRFGPVFNFRSEGRRFDKSNRCLVPASAFFEFTGKKYPKAKHRFALAEAPWRLPGCGAKGRGISRLPSPC